MGAKKWQSYLQEMPILSPQACINAGTDERIDSQIGTGKSVTKPTIQRKRRKRSRRGTVKKARLQPVLSHTVHKSGPANKEFESSDEELDDNVEEEYYIQHKNYKIYGEAISTSKRFKSILYNILSAKTFIYYEF